MKNTLLRRILVAAMVVVSLGQFTAYATGATQGGYASFFGIPLWSTPLISSPWWSTPYSSSPWSSTPYGSTPYESTDPGDGDPVLPGSLAEALPVAWTNQDVSVRLLKTGSADALHFVLDGVGPEDYAGSIQVTKEGTSILEFWGSFLSLIEETPHNVATIRIDKTAPAIQVSTLDEPDGSRKFTLTATDPLPAGVTENSGLGVIVYTIDGGPEVTYVSPFTVPGTTGEVFFWAVDSAGNKSEVCSQVVNDDAVPPTTSASATSARTVADFRSMPTTVTLSAMDGGSGVDKSYYRIGSGANQAYTGPFTVGSGSLTVTFWSVDMAGNTEPEQTLNLKTDGAAPVTAASYPKASGQWASSPVLVTLAAVDAGSGLASTAYSIDGTASSTYTTPFSLTVPIGTARKIVLGISSTDKVGNVEAPQSASVWVDNAVPTAPTALTYSSIATSTLTLSWAASSDGAGSGVAGYEIFKNGERLTTVSGTTYMLTGLTPGSSAVYSVIALDVVGNASAPSTSLTVEMPVIAGSTMVAGTGAQDATVTIPGVGGVAVHMSAVGAPGAIKVTVTDEPPAGPLSGFRFMGSYFDVSFTGTFAAGNTVTVTIPYDIRIPNARALAMRVEHWTGGVWEQISPTVDVKRHTLTFVVSSLSPFALAESSSVSTVTTLACGFTSATNTKSQLITGYKVKTVLVGVLKDAAGNPLSNKAVIVEAWNASVGAWVKVGNATAGTAAGEYRFAVAPLAKTSYRMTFLADPFNASSSSLTRTVYPKAAVGTPKGPKIVGRTKYYTFYGSLSPKHAKNSTVRIYRWRNGKRVSGYLKAQVSSTGTYKIRIKLSNTGKWKLRAYHADSAHAGAWSSGYKNVTSK